MAFSFCLRQIFLTVIPTGAQRSGGTAVKKRRVATVVILANIAMNEPSCTWKQLQGLPKPLVNSHSRCYKRVDEQSDRELHEPR